MGTTEISTTAVTSTVMLVLSILFIIIMAIAALIGFFRRWKRCTVDLCRIVLAVILSAILVAVLGITLNIVEPIATLVQSEIQAELDSTAQNTIWFIVAALYSLTIPFFFVLIFVIIAQILRIPAYFISKALHITKQDEAEKPIEHTDASSPESTCKPAEDSGKKLLEQFGGALISALSALIIISVCILPFTGLFCTFADGLTEFSKEAAQSNAKMQIENDNGREIVVDGQTILYKDGTIDAVALNTAMHTTVAPVRNNFFILASYSAPMKFIYKNITKVKIQNTTVSFCEEMEDIFNLASNSVCFVTDFENYGEKQMTAADKVADYVINSEFHCEIAAEFLSYISKSIDSSTGNEFFDGVVETLQSTTKESVADDVSTVRDIFKSAIRNNIPKSTAKALSEENGYTYVLESINEDFIYDVLSAVKANDRFSGLVSPALNYAFQMISSAFNADYNKSIQAGADLKDLSDEQLKQEASNFATAFSNVKDVITSFNGLNGENEDNVDAIINTDLAPLGAFIDRLRSSLLLGDGSKELLIVILRSETFSENSLNEMFEVIADHVEQYENLSMEKILVSTTEILRLLSEYQSGDGSTAKLAESLSAIASNLDPETAAVTNEIIKKATEQIVDSNENVDSQATQNLITAFVESLSSEEAKEISQDEEAMEKEAAAFECILNMINSGVELTPDEIEDIIVTIASSKIVTSALVSTAYDENGNLTKDAQLFNDSLTNEDKQYIAFACKEYYDTHKNEYPEDKIEEMKSNLAAVVSIFDENVARAIASWH